MTNEIETVTIPLALYRLLFDVAADARDNMECNCGTCDGSCTHGMATQALDAAKAHDAHRGSTAPRWPHASPAFLAEYPWCGWVMAFGADSDTDTTAFGLERIVGLNILLTTADGRSRSVSMVEHRALSPVDGETGGIFFRELDTTHYEPLDPNGLEFAAFADIREIVIY